MFPVTGCSLPTSPARSIPPISTARTSATSSTPRAISPASPTPKSENRTGESNHVEHQSHSPHRHHRHRRDRRELGLAVSRQGIAGRRDRPRAKRRSFAPQVRGDGLAGAQAIGPIGRSVAVEPQVQADLAQAVGGVDLVQENGPERIDFKQKLYGQLDELLPADVIVASSSSGLKMSDIQLGAKLHPERCVIAHPFNPPHLIPLVEIVGGAKTSEETIRRAAEFYTSIGQRTVRLNKEMPGHVASRRQADGSE